jgi:transposase
MESIERRVWQEARAMTRREVITKALAGQISWAQAADIAAVSARQMRRIRYVIERHGLSADQRGGRPRRKRFSAGTIAILVWLKRDIYPDFSLRHFYEQVTAKHQLKVSYNWLRLMLQEAGVVEREPGRGQLPAPTPRPGRDAGPPRRLNPPVDRGRAEAGPWW